MYKSLALIALVLLAGCSKEDKMAMPTDSQTGMPTIESDRPRDVRPPPAQSGMSSDPYNPSGLPGPSTGLGTSPNRY